MQKQTPFGDRAVSTSVNAAPTDPAAISRPAPSRSASRPASGATRLPARSEAEKAANTACAGQPNWRAISGTRMLKA
jgi:hypothetical protein